MRTYAAKSEAVRPGTRASSPLFQRLAISKPDDKCEQEADRVADQVMSSNPPQLSGGKSAAGYSGQTNPVQPLVQTKSVGTEGSELADVPPIVSEVLSSPGQPMGQEVRAFIEPRLGHDFSKIRVHTDDKAAESARAVNSLAYTSGSHLVFGADQYAPATAAGKRLLAHELTHSIQQGFGNKGSANGVGAAGPVLQRQAIKIDLPLPEEEVSTRVQSGPGLPFGLRNKLLGLLEKNNANYTDYRSAIANATEAEKQLVLRRKELLGPMLDALGLVSFARCIEGLGRRAPTFDELRNNPNVAEAIEAAWQASDIGAKDRVTEGHEEGGWIFMSLIDGSLSIQRAKPEGTDFIRLEPPPDAGYGEVLVAMFHTHPTIGRRDTAFPSSSDLTRDKRRGVPNLVAGNLGKKRDVFQVRLSGPAQRKHLASDTKIPGPSGGIGP